jgi:hypothetical protein
MTGMELRSTRPGWGWWTLAWLLLGAGVYVGHGVLRPDAPEKEMGGVSEKEAEATFIAQCKQIRQGMTEEQVAAIFGRLGGPNEHVATLHGETVKCWSYRDNVISVVFSGFTGCVDSLLLENAYGGRMVIPPPMDGAGRNEGVQARPVTAADAAQIKEAMGIP